jgi:tetratricopeptide (TPR) repeat protein
MAKVARAMRPALLLTRRVGLIASCLFALVWVVFSQTLWHDFVNFDDEVYVYQNPVVRNGLTTSGLAWAFAHSHARNWHPLTTISHMADCQLYGLNAGGHHFTSVLLHSISAVMLFLVLRQMTGTVLRSAFAAAIFAIHPLHVESVAWVAERKDVLSGLFFISTLAAYNQYARYPPNWRRYALVVGCFVLGLLCKPMLVTLPLVLLLLDYWPLRRFSSPPRLLKAVSEGGSPRRLLVEKVPLLVLSAISCTTTLVAQSGSVGRMEQLPVSARLANAAVTYVVYLWQTVWPVRLAAFYPYPESGPSLLTVSSAIAILVLLTTAAVLLRQTRPYLFVGWFWYVGMLVPVIGIVQVGLQSHADRYTYLPQIGISIAATWLFAEMAQTWRRNRELLAGVALLTICGFASLAWLQTQHWNDSRTLWVHTAAVTRNNDVAENNLGVLLEHDGKIDEALSHYTKALEIERRRPDARYDISIAATENNLGNALFRTGSVEQAISHYRQAVTIRRDYADGFYNLGAALEQKGQLDEAIGCYEKALSITSDDAAVHASLADALARKHRDGEAIAHYEKAVAIDHDSVLPRNNFAWLLATAADASQRDSGKAIALAREALAKSGGNNAIVLRTLAAAYAENGRFTEAIAAAERGLKVARQGGDSVRARAITHDLELYRMNYPLRISGAGR